LQGRELARQEKKRTLQVIGVDDINRKLDVEVNTALEPVDRQLSQLKSTLDSQTLRNQQLKVVTSIIPPSHSYSLSLQLMSGVV